MNRDRRWKIAAKTPAPAFYKDDPPPVPIVVSGPAPSEGTVEVAPAEALEKAEQIIFLAREVVKGTICFGSGPAAPIFDEFDAEVEAKRGGWVTIDREAFDALQNELSQYDG